MSYEEVKEKLYLCSVSAVCELSPKDCKVMLDALINYQEKVEAYYANGDSNDD